jgi:hypothetical protein
MIEPYFSEQEAQEEADKQNKGLDWFTRVQVIDRNTEGYVRYRVTLSTDGAYLTSSLRNSWHATISIPRGLDNNAANGSSVGTTAVEALKKEVERVRVQMNLFRELVDDVVKVLNSCEKDLINDQA